MPRPFSTTFDRLAALFQWLIFFVAASSIIAEFGFRLSTDLIHLLHIIDFSIIGAYVPIVGWRVYRHIKHGESARWLYLVWFLLGVGVFLFSAREFPYHSGKHGVTILKYTIIAIQVYIIAFVLIKGIELGSLIHKIQLRPAPTLFLSFTALIALGTAALLIPRAHNADLSFIDALFTATSAVCVTGLTVVSTEYHFSQFGHFVILLLMQFGGLGIMTLAAAFAVTSGKRLGVAEKIAIRDVWDISSLGEIGIVLRNTILFVVVAELIGACGLGLYYYAEGMGAYESLRHGIFHAVSAFCNAGFSLDDTSLTGYRHSPFVLCIYMGLIVIGGLGFAINLELLDRARCKLRGKRPRTLRLSVHSRFTLLMTTILIIIGLIGLRATEGIPLLDALFQSVSARTAGFHTIDFVTVSREGLILVIALMFIGAAPGSTGGGVKVSTFGILLMMIYSRLRGRHDTELYGRTIQQSAIDKAIMVIVTSLVLVMIGFFILLLSENAPFEAILFETISAFGTVGLSTGLTSSLSVVGKSVVIALMFLGRLGPLALVLALARQQEVRHYRYPDGKVMIG